jgi:hypothetical protein
VTSPTRVTDEFILSRRFTDWAAREPVLVRDLAEYFIRDGAELAETGWEPAASNPAVIRKRAQVRARLTCSPLSSA